MGVLFFFCHDSRVGSDHGERQIDVESFMRENFNTFKSFDVSCFFVPIQSCLQNDMRPYASERSFHSSNLEPSNCVYNSIRSNPIHSSLLS